VFVQVVDDSKGFTLASASTLEDGLRTFDGDKTARPARSANSSPSARRPPVSKPSYLTVAAASTRDASLPSPRSSRGWIEPVSTETASTATKENVVAAEAPVETAADDAPTERAP
jgi:hypothetical protein